MPPEQKVSTGAVFSITDDAGRREKRHTPTSSPFRIAKAQTTQISFLWGLSTTSDATSASPTTITTTATSTTARPTQVTPNPAWPRRPPPSAGVTPRRNYDRYNPDSFRPVSNRREPPRQGDYDATGFWPNRQNQPAHPSNDDRFSASPVGSDRANDPPNNGEASEVPVVPGRATWFPGSHNNNFSTQQPLGGDSFPENYQADIPEPERGRPTHYDPAYDPFPPDHGNDRQPLKQSSHSQQPLKQGRQEKNNSEYAWDNRHNYPLGYWYWLTAGPKESVTTDRLNGYSWSDKQTGGREGGFGQGAVDSMDVHVGGGRSGGERTPSSWGSWSESSGGQGGHHPFISTTAFSDLNGFVVTSTSSSFELKFRGPPIASTSSAVFPAGDNSDRTNFRPHNKVYVTTESGQQVRDNSFIYEYNSTTTTYPSGRGLWTSNTRRNQSPSRDSNQNSNRDYYVGHTHSSFTRKPTLFTDTTVKKPDDMLGFHPMDPDRHSSVNKDFYETAEDSPWPRDQGREPSRVEVHDIPFRSDTKVEKPSGHAAGSHWVSETIDTSSVHDANPAGSRDQVVLTDGGRRGEPAEAPPVRHLPTTTSTSRGTPQVPILPAGTE